VRGPPHRVVDRGVWAAARDGSGPADGMRGVAARGASVADTAYRRREGWISTSCRLIVDRSSASMDRSGTHASGESRACCRAGQTRRAMVNDERFASSRSDWVAPPGGWPSWVSEAPYDAASYPVAQRTSSLAAGGELPDLCLSSFELVRPGCAAAAL
jgi:hypothetical protein